MSRTSDAPVPFLADVPKSADVVVIGAGIVGLACAFTLQASGCAVLVIDAKGIAEEASFGNAGALAFSDIIPLATKGMLGKVPGWLLDPLGPLSLRPSYLPRIAPWLLKFWRAGWADRVAASTSAQADMMRVARTGMERLIAEAGLDGHLCRQGSLELYESEAEFKASLPGWQVREREGIAFEHLRGATLAEKQPGLSPRFVAGTHVPGWQMVDEPYLFATALAKAAHERGVGFARARVTRLAAVEAGAELVLESGETIAADKVVLCGGAWSKDLASQLGDRIPLETERGYNTSLPPDAFPLERQLIFGGHGFVVSPLSSGIRVGGAVEFAGLKLPPNFARADAMLQKAKAFLPGLQTEGGRQWMGFRPSLPDSLPAIGPSRASPNIFYAFGHGHLGLTQSAGTARLVEKLIAGEKPDISLEPFRPQRFAYSRS